MIDLSEHEHMSAIKTRLYQLQVLTPLLMHGWQREVPREGKRPINVPVQAEARIPSFRGVFRYWWRAVQLDDSFEELLKKEIHCFGGITSGEEDGRRSPVMFRVTDPISTREMKYNILPHRTGKKPTEQLGIPSGETIELRLQMLKKDANMIEQYESIVKLAILLGSFGQRARRGFGSLHKESMSVQSPQQFVENLLRLIGGVNQRFPEEWILSTDAATPQILLARDTPMKHPVLRSIFLGGACDSADRAIYKLSNAGHLANTEQANKPLGKSSPRIASPLLGKVIKIGEDFYPLVVEVHTGAEDYGNDSYTQAKQKFFDACK